MKPHPVDHEEEHTVVCDCSHCNFKSYNNTKLPSLLNVIDEPVACPIEQVAGNAALGEC